MIVSLALGALVATFFHHLDVTRGRRAAIRASIGVAAALTFLVGIGGLLHVAVGAAAIHVARSRPWSDTTPAVTRQVA